ARIPRGVEAQIRPRSGTSFKKCLQIPNAPGTIDSDFPDEWMVIVRNPLTTPIRIDHGERIAQMVLARHEVLAIEAGNIAVTTDRVGGFCSTGR
ncbi:MAG: dUTP diphosphatase, partial [Gemmatimonadaceae bacterium]